MAIGFDRVLKETRFLDPTKGFAERSLETEIRIDPLTGRTSRILGFSGRPLAKPDLTAIVEKSLAVGCPFCPDKVTTVTPQFPPDVIPEPRLHVGGATLVCNMFPYDRYSAVCVMTAQHFVGINDLTEEMLADALLACQTYARMITERDADAKYASINWNYMPLAGASLVHPHLQVVVADRPTNYLDEIIGGSQRYLQTNSSNYWLDLIAKERELGKRYVGATGPVHWLTPFAPRGAMDFMAVFADRTNLQDISREEWHCFARGVVNVAHYLGTLNYHSFNFGMFSGSGDDNSMRVSARIVPRTLMLEAIGTSDINYFEMMHDEPLTRVKPEAVCQELKAYFREGR